MFTKTVLIIVSALQVAACCGGPSPMPSALSVPPVAETPSVAALPAAEPPLAVEQNVALQKEQETVTEPAITSAAAGATHCSQKEDVRTLSTHQEKNGHWVVVYENDGVTHTIPGRLGTLEEATRLFERLKKNLTVSGFSCE